MRTALLLSVASLAILSAPADAATILFSDTGNSAQEQTVSDGGVTQIELENGAVVSIVGPAQFSLRGEEIVIDRGGVTVVGSGSAPVMLRLPGEASAQVSGAGSLTIAAGTISGKVMGGRMVVTSGGATSNYRTGQDWSARVGSDASRVFANGAQPTPRNGAVQTVADAAETGLPVTLGEALAGVGASGDVIAASTNLQAYLANPALRQVPSGDVATLIGFSDRLAAALGGASFNGASPALVNTYLQYLAADGQIGAFQTAYAGLVSQYLTLLATGGFASEYQGADLTALNAYLGYLESVNGLNQFGAGQQTLITAYLDFLAGGGTPTGFIAPGNLLNDEGIAAYVAAITAYSNFLAGGGNPADFGTSASVIQAYLENLAASGLLDGLFGAQAAALTAYLEFLSSGGNPADFTGFGGGGTPVLSDALAAQYVSAIQAYVSFLQGGGVPADFEGGAGLISTYLSALQNAGLFTELLGVQAASLQAYLDFLDTGGAPGDFNFGLSDQLAQQYAAAIQAYIDFITSGGVPSEFAGLPASVFQIYLEALSNAGLFDTLLSDQADFLNAYLAFLQGGGNIDDFDGLPDPITSAQKLAEVQSFLAFVRGGGVPSDFDGATLELLSAFFDEFEVNSDFARNDLEGQWFLGEYFRFALDSGKDPDSFSGLPSNGGRTETLQAAYSIAGANGASVQSFGTVGANPVILDAQDRFAIASSFSGIPTNGSVYQLRDDAVYSELFANDDVIVGRVTNVRVFNDGPMYTLGADQGAHYALVPGLPALPGDVTVDYGLTYATSPTFADGSSAPGTFDADIRLQFSANGQARLATEGSIVMPTDTTYSFATAGGLDGVAALPVTTFGMSAQIPLIQQTAIDLTGTGKACISGTGCTLYMAALPGGADAQFLGVSYETRDGGDGAVTIHGAAAFATDAGDPGDGGSGGDLSTALVGANFDTSFAGSVIALQYAPNGTPIFGGVQTRGPVTRLADGTVTEVYQTFLGRPGQDLYFGSLDTMLIDQRGDDRSLLLTYGAGDVNYFAPRTTTGPALLAMVADAATLLPVSGSATYDLLYKTPAYTIDNALGEGVFDAQLTVTFGSLQKIGLEGSLTFDETYTFSTPGGVADPVAGNRASQTILGMTAPLTGSGALCAAGGNCLLYFYGNFSDDFERIAASYFTTGTQATAYGAAIFGSNAVADLSFASSAESSGVLTEAFTGTSPILSIVDGGGLNRAFNYIDSRVAQISATFDDRGLSTLSTTQTADGNPFLYLDRGDLQTADLAGTADWQVGRFTGGAFADGGDPANASIWGANNGYAYAAIQNFSGALPATGRIDYTLLGATRPTYHTGSTAPGTFTGAMAIALGSDARVGLEGLVTMPDGSYSFATFGGTETPSGSQLTLRTAFNAFGGTPLAVTLTGNGAACGGVAANCLANVQGLIGGENGSLATLSYLIRNTDVPSSAHLTGAAVFGGTHSGGPAPIVGTEKSDQIVMYSATTIGIDSREDSTVTYDDTTGAPLAYVWELNDFTQENERPTIGSNQQNDSGSVAGLIGWTRWAGGTSGGRYYNDTDGVEMPANGGWHIVAGDPAINLPTSGTVNYALVGSTAPTIRDGSLAPGSFSGDLAVAFGSTPRVGVEFDVAIGGNSYAINTPGGIADPMAGGMALDTDTMRFFTRFDEPVIAQGSGPACAGSGGDCRVIINGFLAGDGATHAGVVYTFGNAGFDQQIDGSAVFAAQTP